MISDETVAKIAARLQGSSELIEKALVAEGIDAEVDDVEEALANTGLERCAQCDCWYETYDFDDDNVCEECQ